MTLPETLKILTRMLDDTEHSIAVNGKRLEDAKNECIKDSNTKMWIESNEKRMIKFNEEYEALREAILTTRKQIEYQDWTNKEFLTQKNI